LGPYFVLARVRGKNKAAKQDKAAQAHENLENRHCLPGIRGRPIASGGAGAPGSRVEVVFDHPDKFTDIKDAYVASDKGEQAILDQIRDFIVDRASPMVPEGWKFRITFSDIDLAGEYEPWRGPQWDMVRIIKPVYPPAFRFTYAVTDRAGKVVRQGSEFFRDASFQFRRCSTCPTACATRRPRWRNGCAITWRT